MFRSVAGTGDVTAMEKIDALEEELVKLRELLANIASKLLLGSRKVCMCVCRYVSMCSM